MDYMALAAELAREQAEQFEWDVWGGDVDVEEDADHYATFETLQDAERYKAKTEKANPRLCLRIQRSPKRRHELMEDPFA